MPNHKLITVWIVNRMYVRHDPMGHIYRREKERARDWESIEISQRKLNIDKRRHLHRVKIPKNRSGFERRGKEKGDGKR